MWQALIGGGLSALGTWFGAKERKKERQRQDYYARNRIQITAEDAKKAGIHPLAALGAGAASYTPVGSGGIEAGLAEAGRAVSKSLPTEIGKSQIRLNDAQAELFRAQKLSAVSEMRNRAIGAKGGKTAIPDPVITPFGNIQGAPGTKSEDIEEEYGGALSEAVGIARVISGLEKQVKNNEKNPLAYYRKTGPSLLERLVRVLRTPFMKSANSARRKYHAKKRKN